jgi:hypothetical protein
MANAAKVRLFGSILQLLLPSRMRGRGLPLH